MDWLLHNNRLKIFKRGCSVLCKKWTGCILILLSSLTSLSNCTKHVFINLHLRNISNGVGIETVFLAISTFWIYYSGYS